MANKAQQYITALKEIAIKAQDEFNEKWKDFEEKEKETTPSFGDKLTNEQIDYGIDLDNLLHLFRKTNKEIADNLFISAHTVITHRKNITRKLGIKTVSGLTVYAILNKIIQMEEI